MPERMTPEQADALIARVAELGQKLEVSERQREVTERLAAETRTIADEGQATAETANRLVRKLRVGLALLGAISILLLFVAVEQYQDGQDIEDNQLTSCTNANQVRKAQRELWAGLVLQSKADTPAEERAFELLIDHINIVFAERDCADLGKEYEIPPFPDLGLNQAG